MDAGNIFDHIIPGCCLINRRLNPGLQPANERQRYFVGRKPRISPAISYDFPSHWRICVNPLHANIFSKNINMYLQLLSFLHTDIKQVVEILPLLRQEYIGNMVGTDVLATQGARASATTIFTI